MTKLLLLLPVLVAGCATPRYCADEPDGTGMLCAKTEAQWDGIVERSSGRRK